VLLLLGCAGDLAAIEGGFRHRRHGYAFAVPGPPWTRVAVEHAVIAYRRPDPATMSLQSRCSGPVADPSVMARHLRFGLPSYTLRQAGPVGIGGRSGWTQTLDTQDGVRVKTVTIVDEGCTLDWILVASGRYEDAEADFDAWVASVRMPGEAALAEGNP
jgi:hypothetical protein